MFDALMQQIKEEQSQLLAIQVDPMPYLHKARTFAIENIASKTNEDFFKMEKGIFS